MFKNITINLTEPICTCPELDLSWYIIPGSEQGLRIYCKTCKVELNVPNKSFLAHFKLDKSYPKDAKSEEKPLAKVLQFVKGGKDE